MLGRSLKAHYVHIFTMALELELPDDVLLEIFDLLDEDDLKHCEVVCSRWRWLLFTYFRYKRLYHRNVRSSVTWQKCSAAVRSQGKAVRNIYRQIYSQVQGLYRNWQTANFQKIIHRFGCNVLEEGRTDFIMNDHHLIEMTSPALRGRLLNRKTMSVENEIFVWSTLDVEKACRSNGHVIMTNHGASFRLLDAKTGRLLHEIAEPNGFLIRDICLGPRGLLVTISRRYASEQADFRLNIWRMDNPLSVVHLKQLPMTFPRRFPVTIATDDHFIAVSQRFPLYRSAFNRKGRCTDVADGDRYDEVKCSQTIHFISTDTLDIERSLSLSADSKAFYAQGSLIILNGRDCIRLVDISGGESSPTANLKPFGWNVAKCKSNSRHLVLMERRMDRNVDGPIHVKSKFGVFDLQGIKSGKCNRLLAHFDIPFNTGHFQIDDTEIVCIGHPPNGHLKEIMVLDFMPKQPVGQAKKRKMDDSSC